MATMTTPRNYGSGRKLLPHLPRLGLKQTPSVELATSPRRPELSQAERNVLGAITLRGYCEESDISPEIADSLQARGLIRFDRLFGYYTRS